MIISFLDDILSVEELIYHSKDDWANYPKGVLWAFAQHSYMKELIDIKEEHSLINHGMDILYYGDIPNGSGLSSSASIEVVTAYIIKEIFNIDISLKNMALLCQYAENKYVGVNCGIMDQFAVAMGKRNHAILLNTSTLEYEYAPIKNKNHRIVIANSNKRRGLNDSKYNERRGECEEALHRLKKV